MECQVPKRVKIHLPLHPPSPPLQSGEFSEDNTIMAQLNPFLIEVVVNNLFKYCGRKELCRARLVCKLWHKQSLGLWLEKGGVVKLHAVDTDPSSSSSFVCGMCRPWRRVGEIPSMTSFLEQVVTIPDPGPYQFCGLRRARDFVLQCITGGIECPILNSFWEHCGPWISRLNLDRFLCKDVALFKDVLCSRFTPKLQVLRIDVTFELNPGWVDDTGHGQDGGGGGGGGLIRSDSDAYQVNKNLAKLIIAFDSLKSYDEYIDDKYNENPTSSTKKFPFQWEQVLLLYPNLEYLGASHEWLQFQGEFKKILQAILKIREECPRKLESLKAINMLNEKDISEQDDDSEQFHDASVVRLLQHPLLAFTFLGLRFDEGTEERILGDILSSQPALKKFALFKQFGFEDLLSLFGVMPNLESLEAYGFPFANLSFLQRFPNLRTLTLKADDLNRVVERENRLVPDTRDEDLAAEVVQLASLTEFSCNYDFGGNLGEESISRMKGWMPNISILKMVMDSGLFAAVCEHFPNLEEMVVWCSVLGDITFAGCVAVGRPPNVLVWCQFEKRNVTVLQRLKSFELKTSCALDSSTFSDISVVHGFAKLPRLQHLIIDTAGISADVARVLEERLPFAKVLTCGRKTRRND